MKSFIIICFVLGTISPLEGCKTKKAEDPAIIPVPGPVLWQVVNLGDSLSGSNKLCFINQKIGFLIGGYRKEPYAPLLIRSLNGGNTWQTINLRPPTVAGFINFFAVDSTLLFATAARLETATNSLFKSQDKGTTWIPVTGNFPSEGSHALVFLNNKRGITQTYNGLLLTVDGGQTWNLTFQEEPNYRNFDHLFFLDNLVGFAAGGVYTDDSQLGSPIFNQGAVLKTQDGGQTWQKMKSDFARITSIVFLNRQLGYLTTQRQELWRTVTGGDSWELINTILPVVPASLHFFSQQEGILLGNSKSGSGIYSTADGGKTWLTQYSTTQFQLIDLEVVTPQSIYALGTGNKLLRMESL